MAENRCGINNVTKFHDKGRAIYTVSYAQNEVGCGVYSYFRGKITAFDLINIKL